MRALIVFGISLASLSAASLSARATQRGTAGPPDRQVELRRDVDTMAARLSGPRPSTQQVIADAHRLTAGYRSLAPLARTFHAPEYAVNLAIARHSLEWLARASLLYGRDPLAARAFLTSYDTIGGFYGGGPFYRPGAFVAYAGGARLARRLVLYGLDANWFEPEMERFALAYGSLAAFNGALQTPWTAPHDLPDADPSQAVPVVAINPMPLPRVDVTKLDPAQKAAWTETEERFRNVAPRVHEARILLDDLSHRLQQQHVALHPVDAANALKMQGYLEDAADLIREGRFDTAMEALIRADYVRTKLKSVTGQ
jgi:hypothetical protein